MSATHTLPASTEHRIARLEARLQDGFTRIGEQMANGVDVENWEDAWVRILREYESLNDEIQRDRAQCAEPQQQEMRLGVRRVREAGRYD